MSGSPRRPAPGGGGAGGRTEGADASRASGSGDATAAGVRVILVTAPNEESGLFLARELVEERLAACGNVIPGLVSVYWWSDEVQEDDEVLVILKTTAERVEALVERTEALHPYDVPEVLALPVTGGLDAYARWVARECRESDEDG